MVHSQQGGEYLAIVLFVEHLGAELVGHERHGCRFQQAGAEDDFFQVGIVGIQNFSHTFFSFSVRKIFIKNLEIQIFGRTTP